MSSQIQKFYSLPLHKRVIYGALLGGVSGYFGCVGYIMSSKQGIPDDLGVIPVCTALYGTILTTKPKALLIGTCVITSSLLVGYLVNRCKSSNPNYLYIRTRW